MAARQLQLSSTLSFALIVTDPGAMPAKSGRPQTARERGTSLATHCWPYMRERHRGSGDDKETALGTGADEATMKACVSQLRLLAKSIGMVAN
jgi:hypothetical protein